jgi:hypothetical protein
LSIEHEHEFEILLFASAMVGKEGYMVV